MIGQATIIPTGPINVSLLFLIDNLCKEDI